MLPPTRERLSNLNGPLIYWTVNDWNILFFKRRVFFKIILLVTHAQFFDNNGLEWNSFILKTAQILNNFC